MDDHVARVDQHPVAGFLAFDLGSAARGLFQAFDQLSASAPTWRDERPEQTTM